MFVASAVLKQLLLPPGSLISLALGGLVLGRRVGQRIALAAAVLLYVLSTPLVATSLLRMIQERNEMSASAQAIVILSAGLTRAPEYGGASVDALTLERLRFGATIERRTKLPILVSGGILDHGAPPIATIMSRALAEDYGIAAKWLEAGSGSTVENASMSAPLLKAAGVTHIYLVTHAWHMARARLAFERQGFVVTAAGTGYISPSPFELGDLLPSAKALVDSYYAVHEMIGILYYRLLL